MMRTCGDVRLRAGLLCYLILTMHEILFKRTHFPVSAERVFQWHVEPGALERLTPPWEEARVIAYTGAQTKSVHA